MVDVLLNYDSGLDRYYGLIDIGVKYGVFKKMTNKIQFPNGKSEFESRILKDPAKWFTDDVITALEDAAGKEFKYGQGEEPETEGSESAE